MKKPIRGKVARVLNEREIAINRGTAHGVTVDMYFDIMDPKGLNIKDPDTNEVLGSIERTKVRVKIVRTEEKLSLATTYRSRHGAAGSGQGLTDITVRTHLGPYAQSLMPANPATEYETLKKTGKIPSELDEKDSLVKTGDPVIQVIENNKSRSGTAYEK